MKVLFWAGVSLAWTLAVPGFAAQQSAFFDAKGVTIHYLVEGSGEPVILIHGLYSSATINWKAPGTMAALADRHQVIALDLPGHGRSDKPDREDAYGAQMADDVILLMDHLKIPKAHIVGYSLGGMVALKLIADHPDRVISGLLGGMGWLREGSGLQKVWENLGFKRAGGTPPVCAESAAKLALTRGQVESIQTPMEILVGDHDPVKALYVTPLQAVRKDWRVIEIPDAGHIDCITKPDFIDGISAWVNRNSKP